MSISGKRGARGIVVAKGTETHPLSGLLTVLAHPDDESFVAGGAICHYARRGVRTTLLTLTDGQAGRRGVSGRPPLCAREELGAVRGRELERAAAILEIDELIRPGLRDGGLADVPDKDGADLVASCVRKVRPEVMIAIGPEGGASGHRDHKAASRWAAQAYEQAADPAFEDGQPPHEVRKLYCVAWPEAITRLRGIACRPITTIVTLDAVAAGVKPRAFAEHATQQDFKELYDRIQDAFDGKEHFHLAASRVGFADEMETDLFARVFSGFG